LAQFGRGKMSLLSAACRCGLAHITAFPFLERGIADAKCGGNLRAGLAAPQPVLDSLFF